MHGHRLANDQRLAPITVVLPESPPVYHQDCFCLTIGEVRKMLPRSLKPSALRCPSCGSLVKYIFLHPHAIYHWGCRECLQIRYGNRNSGVVQQLARGRNFLKRALVQRLADMPQGENGVAHDPTTPAQPFDPTPPPLDQFGNVGTPANSMSLKADAAQPQKRRRKVRSIDNDGHVDLQTPSPSQASSDKAQHNQWLMDANPFF